MSIPDFLTDVLESALDQGIGTPSDVLRHATPEELSRHLPRGVWKQLIAAALASSRTDARLVVDTVTIATICKHLPSTIVWGCVAELGERSLAKPGLAPLPGRARGESGAPDPGGRPRGDGGSERTAAGGASTASSSGGKRASGKQGKRRAEDDDFDIDVADERKPSEGAPTDVDDDQLIDWAQAEELAGSEAEALAATTSNGRSAPTSRS
jgi:hypothetical protein